MTGTLTVVVGGLYGSESKGAACDLLARRNLAAGRRQIGMRIGGSQAGHTVYDHKDRRWALRHIPVAAVADPEAMLVIGRGSEVDIEVLNDEADRLTAAGFDLRGRLLIDSAATVIEPDHLATEAGLGLNERTGSTAKGVGAARAARAMRTARRIESISPQVLPDGAITGDTAPLVTEALAEGYEVVIEGVQGHGLSTYGPHYPQCTSSGTDAITFLGMAGLSPWSPAIGRTRVLVVLRPNPIRVAGNSGPMRGETTWEALGLPDEYTTVTKRVRRVGAWDPQLAAAAVRANGGPSPDVAIAMGMLDHRFPEVAGRAWPDLDSVAALEWAAQVAVETRAALAMVGTGPQTWSEVASTWW